MEKKYIFIYIFQFVLIIIYLAYNYNFNFNFNFKDQIKDKINTVKDQIKDKMNIIKEKIKTDLNNIHKKIILIHGSLEEEYPEQLLSVKYIKPTDIVLEIGGNVGRNSCTIGTILNDSKNLLVIESDPENSIKLKENRNNNNLHFLIEDSAISNVDLYQNYWTTKPLNEINDIENWKKINTKSWNEIKNKYNMNFTTLVVDCEGALYYIIKENPNFVEQFNKIIIENDFTDIEHKKFVDKNFKKYNFEKIYSEGPERIYFDDIKYTDGEYTNIAFTSSFYEVWIKK